MNNEAAYHISYETTAYQYRVELLHMEWLAQSPNLNPIENLWRIIKLKVSGQHHQIHSIDDMVEAIKEE